MTKEIMKAEEVGKQIDKIVAECMPITLQKTSEFNKALVLAKGISELRNAFEHPDIKKTINDMKDTHLGFLTDRGPAAIASAQKKNKGLKPYTYNEIKECCIEAMLNGYRITGNEFNIIAGRHYAAKEGKYRKIIEHDGLTDFQYTYKAPVYDSAQQGKYQYARVQCYASYRIDGQLVKMGYSEGIEDTMIFKLRVNAYMGDDAVIGKALSKLFTRVLMRLKGDIMLLPESTDLSDGDIIDIDPGNGSADDLKDKINAGKKAPKKPAPKPEPEKEPETKSFKKKLDEIEEKDPDGLAEVLQEMGLSNRPSGETASQTVCEIYLQG